MPERPHRAIRTRARRPAAAAAVACAAVVFSIVVLAPPARAQSDPTAMDDEQFLRWIESREAGPDAPPVDPRRVAKLVFGVAATLEGNRTNARLLQSALVLREADGEAVRETVTASFGRYEAAIERFRAAVSAWLDRPSSVARSHRALLDGERTCWHLDSYARLTETYGARPADLMSILASLEACQRFRRAAFHPRVQQPIADALDGASRDRAEIDALREEIEELERLVDDLRAIDAR